MFGFIFGTTREELIDELEKAGYDREELVKLSNKELEARLDEDDFEDEDW